MQAVTEYLAEFSFLYSRLLIIYYIRTYNIYVYIQQCVYLSTNSKFIPPTLLIPSNRKFSFYICDTTFVKKFTCTLFSLDSIYKYICLSVWQFFYFSLGGSRSPIIPRHPSIPSALSSWGSSHLPFLQQLLCPELISSSPVLDKSLLT